MVTSTPVALAVKKATTTIPIVMASGLDPVAAGLVDSLARPGGNVTGLTSLATELNTKRLEIIKDAVPKLSRVGLLRPAGDGGSNRSIALNLQLKDLRSAALSLKLKLEEIETETDTKGLESAFQTAKQKHVGAMMTISCAMIFALSYSASAQQPGKISRIGFLDSSTASGSAVLVDAFRQELSKLGWIEGKISPSSTCS